MATAMDLQVVSVSIQAQLQMGLPVGAMLANATKRSWHVLNSAIQATTLRWCFDRGEGPVYVPMFPYLLVDEDPRRLWRSGLQLGAVASSLRVPGQPAPSHILLATDMIRTQSGWQLWLGLALGATSYGENVSR